MAKKITRLTEEKLQNNDIQMREGLTKSYDMDVCKSFMQKKFPNILYIKTNKFIPGKYYKRIRGVDRRYLDLIDIELDCDNIGNFTEIIQTANNMLGWFTHYIDLSRTVKTGYIPYRFFNFNGEFICKTKRGEEIDLYDFLEEDPQLEYFSIILDVELSEVYHQKPNDVFYYATSRTELQKYWRLD